MKKSLTLKLFGLFLMGSTQLSTLRAESKSIYLYDLTVFSSSQDSFIYLGDTVELFIKVQNATDGVLENKEFKLNPVSENASSVTMLTDTFVLKKLEEKKVGIMKFVFKVTKEATCDADLKFDLTSGGEHYLVSNEYTLAIGRRDKFEETKYFDEVTWKLNVESEPIGVVREFVLISTRDAYKPTSLTVLSPEGKVYKSENQPNEAGYSSSIYLPENQDVVGIWKKIGSTDNVKYVSYKFYGHRLVCEKQ